MFNIGDKVIVNGHMDGVDFFNIRGVIRCTLSIGTDRFHYGVDFAGEWDNEDFHDLDGDLSWDSGFYIEPNLVQLAEKYVRPKSGFARFVSRTEKD